MKCVRYATFAAAVACLWLAPASVQAQSLIDSHFHYTNYVQRPGLNTDIETPAFATAADVMSWMKDVGVVRSTIFGIPLQQSWNPFVRPFPGVGSKGIPQAAFGVPSYSKLPAQARKLEPDYYTKTDAELYYFSDTDALIADAYLSLGKAGRQFFIPMITGMNPTDFYAADHVKRMLLRYPGVFKGIGEFTIHKEFVSTKVAGQTASLMSPALDRLLEFCAEAGLVAIIHNDIDAVDIITDPDNPDRMPVYYNQMADLVKRHPNTQIIWAHTGLGRVVKPTKNHLSLLAKLLSETKPYQFSFDISWSYVAGYIEQDLPNWVKLFETFPNRFVWGSDSLAPGTQFAYAKNVQAYVPIWQGLKKTTAQMIQQGNFLEIFKRAMVQRTKWDSVNHVVYGKFQDPLNKGEANAFLDTHSKL